MLREQSQIGTTKWLLRIVSNKFWKQNTTKLHLYRHLPPISQTIQVIRARYARHCSRSKDEQSSDILQWTPTHSVGWLTKTLIHHLCAHTTQSYIYIYSSKINLQSPKYSIYTKGIDDIIISKKIITYTDQYVQRFLNINLFWVNTGCRLEDLPWAMADTDWLLQRIKEIFTVDTALWWRWWWWTVYNLLLKSWRNSVWVFWKSNWKDNSWQFAKNISLIMIFFSSVIIKYF